MEDIVETAADDTNRWSHIFNPKVTWSVPGDYYEKIVESDSPSPHLSQLAIGSLFPDHDGLLRRYGDYNKGPSFVSALLHNRLPLDPTELTLLKEKSRYINFSRPNPDKIQLSLADLMSHDSGLTLKGKVVLIGIESDSGYAYQTPVGLISKTDIFANILDNSIHSRWVNRANLWTIAVVLLGFVLIAGWAMSVYPQAVALLALIWLTTLGTALSIYSFDAVNFLFPIFPILAQVLSVCIF